MRKKALCFPLSRQNTYLLASSLNSGAPFHSITAVTLMVMSPPFLCLACLIPLPMWLAGDYFEAVKTSSRVAQFADIPPNQWFDEMSSNELSLKERACLFFFFW